MIYLLDFIYSPQKRKELEDILYMHHPSHNQRLYFVGFLNKACNMSAKDIKRLIKYYSNWDDYDDVRTDKHVSSICGEPSEYNGGCEDFSYSKSDKFVKYRPCRDTSIFSKLNKPFFDSAERTSYEYESGCYNVYGLMRWDPMKYPIYRSIEGRGHLLFYIDVDGSDLDLCWETAKQIEPLDNWDYFKFSGSKGFHLAKKMKDVTRGDLYEKAREIYNVVKTNLIFFGYGRDCDKPVCIDVSAYNRHRFVRAYSIHMKSKAYSIPVTRDMNLDQILTISRDVSKIRDYISEF